MTIAAPSSVRPVARGASRVEAVARVVVPVATGALALAVYLQTLLPGVGWGDIARFQYVARVWGIPHRFGYPLYIALTRVFGALPIGESVAYRVNLMSALCATLAAMTVYLMVVRLVRDRVAGVSAALSFAFSRALWGQAVVAEVYALNTFLIGVVLLVLLTWHQEGDRRLLYLGLAVYALSFGNHMTVVTLVPAVLFFLLATEPRVFLEPRAVAAMVGLALLGASQYLYVILRAQQQPLLNELGPFSWRGWVHWMTRSRFEGQFFGFGLSDQVDRLRIYLELLEKQVFRWGYILGWIGAWELLKDRLASFIFLALAAVGIYVFGMNYGGVTFRIYLIPSYLIFAVFLGCGLSAVRAWLAGALAGRSRRPGLLLTLGLAAAILAMPLYPVWQNWAEVDESDNRYYETMAREFVDRAGPGFVLVDSEPHYDDLEAILYVAWVEKEWYDARWITPGDIEQWIGTRTVYAWDDGLAYHERYVEEPAPDLSGFVRVVGVEQP